MIYQQQTHPTLHHALGLGKEAAMVQAQDGLVTKDYLDAIVATQTTQLVVTTIGIAGLAIAVAKWVL